MTSDRLVGSARSCATRRSRHLQIPTPRIRNKQPPKTGEIALVPRESIRRFEILINPFGGTPRLLRRPREASPISNSVCPDAFSGHSPGNIVNKGGNPMMFAAHEGTRRLHQDQLQVKLNAMKIVTMLEFRKNAEGVLRRVARGERLVLSHRGKPTARLEPLIPTGRQDWENDPFLSVRRRAKASPKGNTQHSDIDRILYGHP
jgi:prevent-host-death family protein